LPFILAIKKISIFLNIITSIPGQPNHVSYCFENIPDILVCPHMVMTTDMELTGVEQMAYSQELPRGKCMPHHATLGHRKEYQDFS
jgi:hypothetical protein